MIDRDRIVWLTIGVFVGIILGVGGLTLTRRVAPAPIIIEPPLPTSTPAPTATPGPIRVYVNGQVASPAVYELPPNSIVEQAITAAGGFTEAAQSNVVNLAQPLQDGAQIYVPAEDEPVDERLTVVENPPVAGAPGRGEGTLDVGSAGDLIDINSAGVAELDVLPGIGPSTAEKIVEYRESNGPFATIEAIMDVSGIGEAKFNQIKDLITVGGG